ncbi:MAG: hypothetical protein FGM24_09605 [Candidatus Kapabacteria bacterium]|nr:hypothetical protein [Candidatus Kapabacteria bacterium]
MATQIRTGDFPDISPEDQISPVFTAGTIGRVTFALEKLPSITWWKAIELYDGRGQKIDFVELESDNGPLEFSMDVNDLHDARLVFAKAKWFGIHTPMYEMRHLTQFEGQRLHFLWQRDDHTDGPIAGFFRDVGRAVNSATEAVAGAVETVINTVASVFTTAIELVGAAIANAIDWVAGLLGKFPVVGPVLQFVVHWLGTIISSFFSLCASYTKAMFEIIAGNIAAQIRIIGGAIGGLMAWDASLLLKGLYDFAVSFVGPVIAVLGKTAAFIQAVLTMQQGERALTSVEADILRNVYRNSLLLYPIRVVDGFAGLFSTNNRPFTLGNTIYMKNAVSGEFGDYNDVLVHESVHVWQNQHHGQRYVGDALWAQAAPGDEYEWRNEVQEGRIEWRDFNPEAQARFIEDVFRTGVRDPILGMRGEFFNDDPIGSNVTFLNPVDTSRAREATAYLRSLFLLVHSR